MDPLHLCIALGPLAVYLFLLGLINLSPRPFLTTGARDAGALGIAVSGFVVAGPMELFLPEPAAMRFGPFVWVLLLALYALGVVMMVLLMRPRLVVYNISSQEVRRILANVATELDPDARWVGDGLVLPHLGIQLVIESSPWMRNTQLTALGASQSFAGWRRLEDRLARALRKSQTGRNLHGAGLLGMGLLMAGMIAFWVLSNEDGVSQAFGEMLRR